MFSMQNKQVACCRKQILKVRRARRDIRGVKKIADHGHHIGSGVDDLGCIVQRYAADGGDGQAKASGFAQNR